MKPNKIFKATLKVYVCSTVSGKKSINTVLNKTPTDTLTGAEIPTP